MELEIRQAFDARWLQRNIVCCCCSYCYFHVNFSFHEIVIAGEADDRKVQIQAGVTVKKLTQLIFKPTMTSSCRDTVFGELKAVQQPFKSPFSCIVGVS